MSVVVLHPSARSRVWERIAIIAWCAVMLFVSVRVFLTPAAKTVYPIFSASARFWWEGIDLYEPDRPTDVQGGYRYTPGCAVAFTPFALFPDSIGGVLWRLFNVAALFGSGFWLVRAVLPNLLSSRNLGLLALLMMPMALQSVSNGQANLVVIACMIGCIAAVAEERWNLCSILMAVAFAMKLYPLALGMILMLLYPRRLSWRIPLACVVSLLVPFCFQWPDYVIDQYAKWIAVLRADDRADIMMEHMYRDLWLLIYLYDLPISRQAYLLIQMAGGGLVALWCWRRQRAGWPMSDLLVATLALTTAWMMLLGPATESSSFVILAPSFAISVLQAMTSDERGLCRALLWASCVCFFMAVGLGGFVTTVQIHYLGVHVWGSLFYFAYLLTQPRPAVAQELSQSENLKLAA
ncbi:MAG TPA: glycosyltransferase family 87 protein [Gemmataceae bacterium]|nr:glycosyltransferase family 87 protein [Gemmataceae bacterium]